MSDRLRAIRGATQLAADERAELFECVPELVAAMLERNHLEAADVVSVLFNATPDITCGFPAAAARTLDLADTPVLNALELDIPGALPLTVRVMMHAYTPLAKAEVSHVYLRGTEVLRPDLAGA